MILRRLWTAPQGRAAATVVAVLAAVLAVGAATDPSGLLAPVGGRGLPLAGAGSTYRWAPLVVGLPILLAGAAVPVVLVGRRLTARWVFVAAWVATVGASAWASAASGFASAIPVLGPHLSAGLALRYAVSTAGFAALKYLVVGAVVAACAALAFRVGPTAARSRVGSPTAQPVLAPVLVVFAVAALFAVGPASQWWRGGPVGYAFTGFLVAPTAANGVVGFLLGMAVFLAVVVAVVRALGPRLPDAGPLGGGVIVWLAAVVVGLGLGVVDAAVAPLSGGLSGAGPDNWWISTALIGVATGLSYGAAVGLTAALLVVLLVGLGSRWPSVLLPRPHPRSRLGALVVAGVLLLALAPMIGAPVQPGPPSVAAVAGAGGLQRLRVHPAPDRDGMATIGDVTGRQVILRGVNVNQLIDYYLRDPAVPATQPLTDGDFAQMAAMGFNVIRLGMSWSLLEPERGRFDQSYLRQIQAAVAAAKAHGIYTVLDMHQDAWGNALARPSEQCGGATTPTTGWDGAPAWATITDGTAHCQFLARDLAPAVATAFGNLYTDRDGIQTELVRTWAFVARAFADEPAVAGYDLLNEPGIGPNPPISSGLLLGRFYDAAITAIREAERAAGGFPHIAFFQPSVLWSGLGFDVTPPPGFTADRQLVFAPHPYSESISMDQSLGLTIASIERNLTVSARAAAAYGAALWTGEWGWFGEPAADGAKMQRFAAARAFPGRLESLTAGPRGTDLRITATAATDPANCQVDIWFPGEAPPRLRTTSVLNASAEQVPGGWRITGCASGAYSIMAT
ncbi:glycoside hydrolase family 5 protein [Dactylosporangium sp. NBC_01737]|uniref:cellulase family glycosylhydrolase n=1 Tax=Dactylosporangium sp. NBC_01737 TaxID=2975959 RepID=UPI002E0D0F78|nr:glycoside hydrolase family 5 protein [Dactylosporangium sp. NBC_01737]